MDAETSRAEAADRYAREQRLAEIRDELNEFKDGLGHPLDAGIVETLVGLRAHGIRTSQSCAGHDDRALALPWVDIDVPEPENLEDDVAVMEWMDANAALARDTRRLLADWEVWRSEHGQPPLPTSDRLGLREMGIYGAVRLEPNAQRTISALQLPERARRTVAYRQLMNEFADYLQQRYLEDGEEQSK